MRIKHFFGLAVLAAMTASCSSNNELVNGGNGSGENESGASYASFSINLPTTSGTRADGGPTFEDGNTDEYKVNDATLLIFKKGSTEKEGDYTFVESAELGSMAPWKDPNETGVTTHAKITAKLESVNKNDKNFALVLLNNGTGTNAKVDMPSVGEKFSVWNATATDKFAKPENGFYMANAPLFKDNNVTTLVPIESTKIYPTEEEAAKNAATDIYVERGLAKVTLGTGTTTEKTVNSSTYQDDKVTISNWVLDVTNQKAYPIHNVDGLTTDYPEIWKNDATATTAPSTQRFVDNSKATAKRVYWGKDPNYDKNDLRNTDEAGKTAREAEFNYVANKDVTEDPAKPLYCLENTFNLDNMMQGQTTRIVFKATYKPASLPKGEKTFYKIGKNTAIWSKDNLETEIKTAVASVFPGVKTDNISVKLDAEKNNITAAGTHYIKADNITVKTSETEIATITPENITAINTQLGLKETDKVGISTYAGGESYYVARIKHFGDELTPWSSGGYGSDNLPFLGRYGMLRNNWYELTVSSVSGPGYPSVPEVKPNTPDDEDDKYISVSVKILKWAKRTQDVKL
ncbi:hypothetical protein DW657_05305 [Prevotella sp. AM23-5]|uniref:Mfa1 family fimbria major subunit n=1 Tax=Prevotellaceae TaxID=171552 RepID=UPI000E4793BF|nr:MULTISPECIES: Mfa1 family fimbria major subunit [Prevotellaceae]RHN97230.1 hypothetical protein DW657_05305 [Prevotella sp. AM23-5]